MMVVINELKKIFNIKIILVAVALCFMYYLILMDVHISNFPSWRPGLEITEFMHEIADIYGTSITPFEVEAFLVDRLEVTINEIEIFMQANPIFAKAGVYTFEELQVLRSLSWDIELTEYERLAIDTFFWHSDIPYNFRIGALNNIEFFWYRQRALLERQINTELYAWFMEIFDDVTVVDDVLSFIDVHLKSLLEIANTYIQEHPLLSELGITNFEEFRARSYILQVNFALWRSEYGFISERIFALESLQSVYKNALSHNDFINQVSFFREHQINSYVFSERGQQRIGDILEYNEYWGVMDGIAYVNTLSFFTHFYRLNILIVSIFILPFIAYDRMRNLTVLQYSTKIGRHLILKQLTAVVIASMLITTVMVVIFGYVYSTTGILRYWNHGIVSFANDGFIYFFRFTFAGYFSLLIAMMYIIAMGTAFFAFVISRYSRNLVSSIIKGIPALFLIYLLTNLIFDGVFHIQGELYTRTGILGIELISSAVFFILAISVAVFVVRCESLP